MTKVRAHVAWTIASAMSALALGQSTAFAQAAPATSADSAAPADVLQEVVVTAEFRTEKLQETPIAITAVNAEAMQQRNMTNLIDIANVAPNVTMFANSAAFGKTNAAFIRACISSIIFCCMGWTLGKPMKARASSGVMSISICTFMAAPFPGVSGALFSM